jgi:CRP-like cAMP-binding protein
MIIDINTLLAWGAVYKKVGRNEVIFSEGAACSYYNQLVTGTVKWVNIDEEGKEYIQTIIEPGECFGELPLFDDGLYAASAIAEEDVILIRLRKTTFLQLIKENNEIHFAFTKLLAKRVRFKFLLLKSIAYHAPEVRISALLNYLKKENRNFCTNCNQLKLTRQQIADMTGLRVETVIRSMRMMHDKGDIVIEKGKVYY